MKSAMARIPLLLAAMMLTGYSTLAFSQEKGADKPKTKGKGKTPGEAKAKGAAEGEPAADGAAALEQGTQGLGSFGKLLPLNEKNIDVKIPSFKDGRPSSLLRAGSMTRVDDENMELEKTDIRLYGEVQDKDVRVQLVTGVYNMPSQVLSSDQRSRVSRTDFQIEGDSMIFDTRTQQGKLVGNVRMTIFDSQMLTGTPPPEEAKDKAEPKDNATAKPDPKVKTTGKTAPTLQADSNEKK